MNGFRKKCCFTYEIRILSAQIPPINIFEGNFVCSTCIESEIRIAYTYTKRKRCRCPRIRNVKHIKLWPNWWTIWTIVNGKEDFFLSLNHIFNSTIDWYVYRHCLMCRKISLQLSLIRFRNERKTISNVFGGWDSQIRQFGPFIFIGSSALHRLICAIHCRTIERQMLLQRERESSRKNDVSFDDMVFWMEMNDNAITMQYTT